MSSFLSGLFLQVAKADDLSTTVVKLPDPLGGTTLPGLIDKIFTFMAFQAGPVILTIFILVGGYQMMFARGEAESFTKGKNTIVYAVMGYALLLLAKGITAIVKSILTVH